MPVWQRSLALVACVLSLAPVGAHTDSGILWQRRSDRVSDWVERGNRAVREAQATMNTMPLGDVRPLAAEALRAFEAALALAPDDVELHYQAFMTQQLVPRDIPLSVPSTLRHLDRMRQLAPRDPRDPTMTMLITQILGRQILYGSGADEQPLYQRLISEYERVFHYFNESDPDIRAGSGSMASLFSSTHSNVAEIYMAAGDLEQAIWHYQQSLARGADRLDLGYFGLALAYDRNGQQAFAVEMMHNALRLSAGELDVLANADNFSGDLDVYFVPSGDKFAYWALALEVKGDVAQAQKKWAEYLRRAVTGRPEYRQRAREHLEALAKKTSGGGGGR